MDKQTSDERLLKLIEGSSDAKRRQNGQQVPKKTLTGMLPGKLNLNSLKAWKGFKPKLFDLNRGLIGFAGLITIIFVYSLFSGPVISKSTAAYFSPADAASVSKVISAIQTQGLMRKNILGQDIKRNIFVPSGSKSSAYTQQEGMDLTEQVKDLKLVGIVWSANPEIMIENAKDSRTYLLKKGDSFNNDKIKVKEISRNSAILEILTDNGSKVYEIR
jgi:hypothetical protein